jgi:hypothetical protein
LPLHDVAQVGVILGIAKNRADLLNREIQALQMGDHPGGLDLRAVVVAISGLVVHARRDQQPLLMVKPQGFDRQPRDLRELADREHKILARR